LGLRTYDAASECPFRRMRPGFRLRLGRLRGESPGSRFGDPHRHASLRQGTTLVIPAEGGQWLRLRPTWRCDDVEALRKESQSIIGQETGSTARGGNLPSHRFATRAKGLRPRAARASVLAPHVKHRPRNTVHRSSVLARTRFGSGRQRPAVTASARKSATLRRCCRPHRVHQRRTSLLRQ
jgi:hypothetical protein